MEDKNEEFSPITNYLLSKLSKYDINLQINQYSEITPHMYDNDEFSINVRTFIMSSYIKTPAIEETDHNLIKTMLKFDTVDFEYEAIGIITLEDMLIKTGNCEGIELEKNYEKYKNKIMCAYLGLTLENNVHLVAGFLDKDIYNNFSKFIEFIDVNENIKNKGFKPEDFNDSYSPFN